MAYNLTGKDVFDLTTSGAYSAGDVIGGLQEIELSSGYVVHAILIDQGAQDKIVTAYIFDEQPTTVVDNAAITGLSPADWHKLLSTVVFDDFAPIDTVTISEPSKKSPLVTHNKSWIYFVATEAATYTNGALRVKLVAWED